MCVRFHERVMSAFCPVAVEERKILRFLLVCSVREQRAGLGLRQEHFLRSILLLFCKVFLRASPETPGFLLQIKSTWRWRIKGVLAISSGDKFSC